MIRALVPAGWRLPERSPYAPGVLAGDYLFVSGQLPLDPISGQMAGGDVGAQTAQALANLRAVLQAADADLADLVKVTVYLLRRADWEEMNAGYLDLVGPRPPARSAIVVAELAPGAEVEIEGVAFVGGRCREAYARWRWVRSLGRQ